MWRDEVSKTSEIVDAPKAARSYVTASINFKELQIRRVKIHYLEVVIIVSIDKTERQPTQLRAIADLLLHRTCCRIG